VKSDNIMIIRLRTKGYLEYINYRIEKGLGNKVKIKIPKTLSLEVKCPIDQGEPLNDGEVVAICPNCYTVYHLKCIKEVLKSNTDVSCFVCEKVKLSEIIKD